MEHGHRLGVIHPERPSIHPRLADLGPPASHPLSACACPRAIHGPGMAHSDSLGESGVGLGPAPNEIPQSDTGSLGNSVFNCWEWGGSTRIIPASQV